MKNLLIAVIMILISLHSNADCVETLKSADEAIKACDLYAGSLESALEKQRNTNLILTTEVETLKIELETKDKWYNKPEYSLLIGFIAGSLTMKGFR